MATLRVKTKIAGVLADVTEVRLSDPAGTFGLRTGESGAILVADGTAMTRVSTGTYEYEVTLPASYATVAYRWWAEIVYRGETHHLPYLHEEPPAITPVASTDPRAIQEQADLDCLMADYGQAVTVYTSPDDLVGRGCTGIVAYNDAAVVREPRTVEPAITIKLSNSATAGISGSEWTEDYEVAVPSRPGVSAARKRTTRMLAAGRFGTWITWELG